jgi:hypothetical protein
MNPTTEPCVCLLCAARLNSVTAMIAPELNKMRACHEAGHVIAFVGLLVTETGLNTTFVAMDNDKLRGRDSAAHRADIMRATSKLAHQVTFGLYPEMEPSDANKN